MVGYAPAASLRHDTTGNVDYAIQFQRVLDIIYESSVTLDPKKTKEELFDAAVDAILKASGDKHGRYYSLTEYRELSKDIRPPNYVGVGINITAAPNGAMIVGIFDDSPLSKTNIKVGDVITAAGTVGQPLVEWNEDKLNLRELHEAIIGTIGTKVVLHVKRGVLNFKPITVTRLKTRQQYVYMTLSDLGVLTVRMTKFPSTLYKDTIAMLYAHGWMTSGGMLNTNIIKGVVLDLRYNPGGVHREAVYISDLYFPRNKVVISVSSRL